MHTYLRHALAAGGPAGWQAMSELGRGYLQAVAFSALVVLTAYTAVGFPAILFSVALVGGMLLWRATTMTRPVPADRIIVPYLVTVLMFIVHVGEEYATHIEVLLSALSGRAVTEAQFLLFAAFFAPAFWILGAILLLNRVRLGGFVASVFYFGMIAGEASHFAFPFMLDGRFRYAPGMVTAGPLIFAAAYALRRTVVEARTARGA
jgi:hypothetical protein